MVNEDQHIKNIENDYSSFNQSFQDFLNYYKKQSKRLDKIIKQSDKQQMQILKLNEELDEYKNKLEKKVEQKTKDLQELNLNLEKRVKDEVEANRQKDRHLNEQAKFVQLGELVSNIAHQWRQPLSHISTLASNIQVKRELDINLYEDENSTIEQIIDTTKKLSLTIDNFRHFAQLENEYCKLNINEHLKSTIALIESSLMNDGISIIYDYPKYDIEIETIPSSLSQAVLKLISNAQDALNKVNSEQNKNIDIVLEEDDIDIIISIKDNANGISADILPRIFDPYFTTKHQSQGTGLGLYVARESIEKHLNGIINLDTNSSGTTFIIKIPKNL